MQDDGASRRVFFAVGLAAAAGALLTPQKARAVVARAVAPPQKLAELHQFLGQGGQAQLGRMLFELNETARFIYERCDGTRSTDAIARELAVNYDIPLSAARSDTGTCVAQLREMGLIQ